MSAIDTRELRAWAKSPMYGTDMVPVHRNTLIKMAEEIEALWTTILRANYPKIVWLTP